jgi:hypothetical protein
MGLGYILTAKLFFFLKQCKYCGMNFEKSGKEIWSSE